MDLQLQAMADNLRKAIEEQVEVRGETLVDIAHTVQGNLALDSSITGVTTFTR